MGSESDTSADPQPSANTSRQRVIEQEFDTQEHDLKRTFEEQYEDTEAAESVIITPSSECLQNEHYKEARHTLYSLIQEQTKLAKSKQLALR